MWYGGCVLKRSRCSLTAMDGLGTEALRTRITGVGDQDQKGSLGRGAVGLLDVSDHVTIECV